LTSPTRRRSVFTLRSTGNIAIGFRRDKDIPSLIERVPNSFGILGSDALFEQPPEFSKTIAAGVIGRLAARFAVAARREEATEVLSRLRGGEKLNWATSNPRQLETNALRYGFGVADVLELGGSVEAALDDDPELDVVLDIVSTGKTMFANKLEIIQDNVAGVALMGICKQSLVSKK